MKTEGWQARFRNVLKDKIDKKFAWGEFDCVVLACECVTAVTEDLKYRQEMRRLFGEWRNCFQAARAHGFKLGESVSKVMGDPTNALFLSMGDIALAEVDAKEIVVVHDGCNFLAPCTTGGLEIVPLKYIQYGWKV